MTGTPQMTDDLINGLKHELGNLKGRVNTADPRQAHLLQEVVYAIARLVYAVKNPVDPAP
jgi:hypothetical protein